MHREPMIILKKRMKLSSVVWDLMH